MNIPITEIVKSVAWKEMIEARKSELVQVFLSSRVSAVEDIMFAKRQLHELMELARLMESNAARYDKERKRG